MKKNYTKPLVTDSNGGTNMVPALAVGAALAGGYALGRAVKAAFEIRTDSRGIKCLTKVTI